MDEHQNRIHRWLDVARWAASGGNAQPWTVEYDADDNHVAIRLRILPDYKNAPSPMDVGGAAAAIALGCFACTLTIAARGDGFWRASTDVSDGANLWESAVTLRFSRRPPRELAATSQELQVADVRGRWTDRGPYSSDSLPPALSEQIERIVAKAGRLKSFVFAGDRSQLLKDLLPLEKVRWHNPYHLDGLLQEISFSENQVGAGDGIPVQQLGVSHLDQWMLRCLKQSAVVSWLFRTFASGYAAHSALRPFGRDCNRVFFLQAVDARFATLLQFGECFQEIWLEANRSGVSFQPLGLPLVALRHWQNTSLSDFYSPGEIRGIEAATERLHDVSGLDLRLPVIGFRVGRSSRPAMHPPRRSVQAQARPGLLLDENSGLQRQAH